MVFQSSGESAEVVCLGKEPLHRPAFSIAAQLAAILSSAFASTPIRGNQFDPVLVFELLIERVRVVGFAADEMCQEFVEKASGKNLFHKLALGRRGALDRYGERNSVISGDSDDLRALAAAGGVAGELPFLRSRTSRPRAPLPVSADLAHADVAPASAAPLPASRCGSIAGIGDGRSGTADISPVVGATVPRFPVPQTRRSARPAYRATVGRGCPSCRSGRSTRSTTAHCSSVSPHRLFMAFRGHPRAASGIARNHLSDNCETGSDPFPSSRIARLG